MVILPLKCRKEKSQWDHLNCKSADSLNSFIEEEKFVHVLELMEAYPMKRYMLLQ
ncbi:hypothetical protein HAX54_022117, partial [Datura stramonium]|nr:hypothetical protein [Datura stramonium]